jgi:hypothetical protein
MGFDSLVRSMVKLANNMTSSLQDEVEHYAWIGTNDASEDEYDVAVIRKGIIEYKQRMRYNPDNAPIISNATITFLEPVTENGAEHRKEPIDPRDKFVLPDGATGVVINTAGLDDPKTHHPYFGQVFLG